MYEVAYILPSLCVSTDGAGRRKAPERCPRPPYSQDRPEEDVPENRQTVALLIDDHPRTDKNRNHVAAGILNLSLQITSLITTEEYTAVKKTATPIIHPHSLIQKLLELTNKMTELLTGEKIPRTLMANSCYQDIVKWKMKTSCRALQEKTSLLHLQDFTVQIHHIIPLIMKNLLLTNHRWLSELWVRVTGKVSNVVKLENCLQKVQVFLRITELTQERSRIHVQNVGDFLQVKHTLLRTKKFTQKRNLLHVQIVGNPLQLKDTLLYIREVTQERSRIHVQNVGKVLHRNQVLLSIREFTQGRSRIPVQNVGEGLLLNANLQIIRKLTQRRACIHVQSVGKLL
ncbi:hypothetical protein GDO78_017097 [Eleutherodactylus coqui]|uniref:Uncharacterized protein n=1 Tax=Eleutherodactylus coqui TaxID=57060 RepID=A0A8J6BJT2_ELECQ|nr:hypothetical protein GDO78_017097 [Eleutherodactylus coqui]